MSSFGDLHHVGITVRDLDASLSWYKNVFGVEPTFIADGSGPDLSQAVGVPGAKLRFAMLSFGSSVVELLCYDNERQEAFDRSNADVGSAHVCIHVPDLQSTYDDLRKKGIEFLAPPLLIEEGPLEGCSFVYFNDPDGVTLELFQTANGSVTHG